MRFKQKKAGLSYISTTFQTKPIIKRNIQKHKTVWSGGQQEAWSSATGPKSHPSSSEERRIHFIENRQLITQLLLISSKT